MRGWIALFVAVLLGFVAVIGMQRYMERQKDRVQKQFRPVKVVTATQRIERGDVITRKMFTIEDKVISESNVDQDHILSRDVGWILGKVANRPIERGQIIKWSSLQQEVRKVTTELPPGLVAFTLPVDSVSGVGGNIRPNSHVDLIGTFNLPRQQDAKGRGADVRAVRMLTNITVLAVDNRTTLETVSASMMSNPRPYSTVTLAVTPEEAVVLAFARSQGALLLTIRNASDPLTAEPDEVTINTVIETAKRANARRRRMEPASPATP